MVQEQTRPALLTRCMDLTPRDRRNQMLVLGSLAVWAVCFTGVSQLIKRDLLPAGPMAWLLAALPSVAGILVLFVYARYLRQADELRRFVELQALALGFGGTFFAIGGYQVFERLGAPAAELGDAVLLMAVLYTLGSLLGWMRYR